jgi:hypothetical protein
MGSRFDLTLEFEYAMKMEVLMVGDLHVGKRRLVRRSGGAGRSPAALYTCTWRVRISEFGKSGVMGMKQGKDSRFVSSNSGIHSK